MLAAFDKSWAFIRVPRCASNSISRWLEGQFETRQVAPMHSSAIPRKFVKRTALVWSCGRDPLERAISLWHFYNRRGVSSSAHRQLARGSFEEFCAMLIRWREERDITDPSAQSKVELFPQSAFFQNAGVTVVVRLEVLPLSLREVPFIGVTREITDFPHLGKSEEKRPKVTPRARGFVERWAADDYEVWRLGR